MPQSKFFSVVSRGAALLPISGDAFRLLVVLLSWGNGNKDNLRVTPSLDTLERALGRGIKDQRHRVLKQWIAELELVGLVVRQDVSYGAGKKSGFSYDLTAVWGKAVDLEPARPAEADDHGVDLNAPAVAKVTESPKAAPALGNAMVPTQEPEADPGDPAHGDPVADFRANFMARFRDSAADAQTPTLASLEQNLTLTVQANKRAAILQREPKVVELTQEIIARNWSEKSEAPCPEVSAEQVMTLAMTQWDDQIRKGHRNPQVDQYTLAYWAIGPQLRALNQFGPAAAPPPPPAQVMARSLRAPARLENPASDARASHYAQQQAPELSEQNDPDDEHDDDWPEAAEAFLEGCDDQEAPADQ